MSQSLPSRRVLVLGTGAMGCLMAALMGRTGEAEVTIAGSWTEGLAAVDRDGVTVLGSGGGFNVPVFSARREAVGAAFDLVLVLVKSWQTEAVAPAAARATGGRGAIVSLQNGLGNLEQLRRYGDPQQVFGGTTTLGATLLEPARIRWAGKGNVALPSALEGGPLPRLIRRAGIALELFPDIEPLRWLKLAVNCGINPLTAILQVRNGELLEDADVHRALQEAAREVGAVAAAKGIELDEDPVAWSEGVARATAANRSSMLQDLDRGRRTEIDALNFAVVEAGRRVGVATPVNEWLSNRIRELEGSAPGDCVPSARRPRRRVEEMRALWKS